MGDEEDEGRQLERCHYLLFSTALLAEPVHLLMQGHAHRPASLSRLRDWARVERPEFESGSRETFWLLYLSPLPS